MHMGKPLHLSFFLSLPFPNLKIEYNCLLGFVGGNSGSILANFCTCCQIVYQETGIAENQPQERIPGVEIGFFTFSAGP